MKKYYIFVIVICIFAITYMISYTIKMLTPKRVATNETTASTSAEIATFVPENVSFDDLSQQVYTTAKVFPANTIHSISFKVLSGTCDFAVGSDVKTYVINESFWSEATTKFKQNITLTPAANSTVYVVTTH